MQETSTIAAYDSLQELLDAHRAGGGVTVPGVVRAVVAARETRPMKGERTYEELTFQDFSAVLKAKDFRSLSAQVTDPCVQVTLEIETYKDEPAAVVSAIIGLPDLDPLTLTIPDLERHAENERRLAQAINSLDADGPYRALVEAAMQADGERFRVWTAATKHHHNFTGGLLEHTLEVLTYATGIAALDADPYDRELLVAGCLLHDLGKLDEYAPPPALGRSPGGELAYHLAYGSMRLGMAAQAARAAGGDIPDHVLWKLVHLIEQSHGAYRLDRAREPVGKEALCLSSADLHSARRAVRDRERRVLDELAALERPAEAEPAAVVEDEAPF